MSYIGYIAGSNVNVSLDIILIPLPKLYEKHEKKLLLKA